MKNNTKVIVGLVIVLVVALGVWFALGRTPADEQIADPTPRAEPAPTADPVPTPGEPVEPADIYPLDTDVVLTYWLGLPAPHVSANFVNFADTPLYKHVFEKTGITVEFLHPPEGQATEQFNLMIASGELPDIVEWNWHNYPGGVSKAIADGIIRPLNAIIEDYAPNLSRLFAENPSWARQAMNDEGHIHAFPFIRDDRDGDNRLHVWFGIFLRNDWLNRLNLPVPETYAEWETTLTAFRDNIDGVTAPLSYESFVGWSNPFLSGFGSNMGFFMEGDEVLWGPMQPGFRDWLELFHRWYDLGLLDQEIATVDRRAVEAKVLGNQTGATVGMKGGRLGHYLFAMKEVDPEFDLIASRAPVINRGDPKLFGMGPLSQGAGAIGTMGEAAITTDANDEEVEIAARFLDFGYTQEGYLVFNYGIENESYAMVDGMPRLTDIIFNHPEGWPLVQALSAYARTTSAGPFMQSKMIREQVNVWPQQVAAAEPWTWSNFQPDGKYTWLPRTTPTAEEATELASIMSQLNTLRDETVLRIITGAADINEWEAFKGKAIEIGIERAIEIQEAAVQRFKVRHRQ